MQNPRSLQALLINKKKGLSFTSHKPVYELVFQTRKGIISLETKEEEYYSVMIGNQGLLRYNEKNVLSFGSWIQESTYPQVNHLDLYWLNM